MNSYKNMFTTASGIFAVIPGLGILLSNIGVPPNTSKLLFSGIVESLGVFTLLLLWLNQNAFLKMPDKKINIICLISIFIFLFSITSYIYLFNILIIPVDGADPVFFPLWAEGELQRGLDNSGSRSQLISDWGRDDVFKIIQKSSHTYLQLTTLLLLFIFQLIFVSLTFSFGLLSIKSSKILQNRSGDSTLPNSRSTLAEIKE